MSFFNANNGHIAISRGISPDARVTTAEDLLAAVAQGSRETLAAEADGYQLVDGEITKDDIFYGYYIPMTYTIRLQDDTVGTISAATEPLIGSTVTVNLQDENGNSIEVEGVVADILEAKDY